MRRSSRPWLASGDLPDTMWGGFTRLEAMDFGTKGALYPIDTLSDMMPNLATWREKYPEYDAAMTAPDGHQYSTTSVYNYTQLRRAPSISPSVHDLGVDPRADIQTMDDLLDVLGQFKARWPENHPWVTRRGIRDGYHVMFGTNHSVYLNPETDRWTYGELEENYRGMIEILRQAWADGLMHPDFMSMGEDPWREIMSQGKAYFTTGAYSQISWQGTDPRGPQHLVDSDPGARVQRHALLVDDSESARAGRQQVDGGRQDGGRGERGAADRLALQRRGRLLRLLR